MAIPIADPEETPEVELFVRSEANVFDAEPISQRGREIGTYLPRLTSP